MTGQGNVLTLYVGELSLISFHLEGKLELSPSPFSSTCFLGIRKRGNRYASRQDWGAEGLKSTDTSSTEKRQQNLQSPQPSVPPTTTAPLPLTHTL